MRSLSQITAKVVGRNFSRKYIALGRIVNHWNEIVGDDFADKAQPVKLNYRKHKESKKPQALLDIATTGAHATALHYRKDLILERINRIFGEEWITGIRFVTAPSNSNPVSPPKKTPALNAQEENYLTEMLDGVQDHDIKDRLRKLGRAIITEEKT